MASIFYAHFLKNKTSAVYGCSYDNNLQLNFSRATDLKEIRKFKTSKYSISYIGNTYKNIRQDLINGLYVLFIGTPCQVSGLNNFLNKEYPNLLTIDLICHGVPSQIYLDEYIKSLNLNTQPNSLTFRGKKDFFFTLYKDNTILYSKNSDEDISTIFFACISLFIYRSSKGSFINKVPLSLYVFLEPKTLICVSPKEDLFLVICTKPTQNLSFQLLFIPVPYSGTLTVFCFVYEL